MGYIYFNEGILAESFVWDYPKMLDDKEFMLLSA